MKTPTAEEWENRFSVIWSNIIWDDNEKSFSRQGVIDLLLQLDPRTPQQAAPGKRQISDVILLPLGERPRCKHCVHFVNFICERHAPKPAVVDSRRGTTSVSTAFVGADDGCSEGLFLRELHGEIESMTFQDWLNREMSRFSFERRKYND